MVTTRISRPPFHADQVGSLLRPKELHEARAAAKAGKLAAAALKAVEDRAIAQAVKKQEAIGLPAVTDDEFWADLGAAYRKAIGHLYDAGCRYLQLDDVGFSYLCDEKVRENFRKNGDDPKDLPRAYAQAINMGLEARPPDLAVTLHTCRGNFRSTWFAAAGYQDEVVAAMFSANVDGYFMEYDSERAGGFEPLRLLPKGKKVVLGLVTTKSGQLESKDSLKRRIDEAATYVPLENLCLSPQCGFASTHHGNKLTEDEQWKKLERIVDVARDVWKGRP